MTRTIVIYDRGDGTGPEILGPFNSEKQAERYCACRKAGWPPEILWPGSFTVTKIISPWLEDEKDPRIKMLGLLG